MSPKVREAFILFRAACVMGVLLFGGIILWLRLEMGRWPWEERPRESHVEGRVAGAAAGRSETGSVSADPAPGKPVGYSIEVHLPSNYPQIKTWSQCVTIIHPEFQGQGPALRTTQAEGACIIFFYDGPPDPALPREPAGGRSGTTTLRLPSPTRREGEGPPVDVYHNADPAAAAPPVTEQPARPAEQR